MAAYGAVVSLMNLMEQIQMYHARHPVFLYGQQRQLESLQQKVSFLLEFLESYSPGDSHAGLESQIADVVYAAEDVIESHVVDDVQARHPESSSNWRIRSDGQFSVELQKILEEMEMVKKGVLEITEKNKFKVVRTLSIGPVASVRTLPTPDGFTDLFPDYMNQMMDSLTSEEPGLLILSITGMGGIGKSTLAKNVYNNLIIIKGCFDKHSWVTVSQEYNEHDLLVRMLRDLQFHQNEDAYHQLGVKLHQGLSNRRYLLVMDDIWDVEAFDKVKVFLPDNNNGSRIIVTTRMSKVANNIGSYKIFKMNLLDENGSWRLLQRTVFAEETCPPELEEIGKKIAINCKGLALSIAVIGGLLAKSMNQEYWEYVAKDTSILVNSNDGDHCLKILSTSYHHLPVQLKPCFLYFGVYPEDGRISVSMLLKLWVAEGFLKSKEDKTLEEVARAYLKDLTDRNLIIVHEVGSVGGIKSCKIHDLLRDFCLREAQRERFLTVIGVQNGHISQDISCQRRVSLCHSMSNSSQNQGTAHDLQSASVIRSITVNQQLRDFPLQGLRLLRVLNAMSDRLPPSWMSCEFSSEGTLQLVSCRFLCSYAIIPRLPPTYQFWNLQTIILTSSKEKLITFDIWNMSQLRHLILKSGFTLPNPPSGSQDDFVLENLQTLQFVHNFSCSLEVLKKLPNIKKLGLRYYDKQFQFDCLHNLGCLDKLNSLSFSVPSKRFSNLFHRIEFSTSLKKLSLSYFSFEWEDIVEKIGLLRHLEKLVLFRCFGKKWNTVEGQFRRLKFLSIWSVYLERWTVDSSTHFPLLENLSLQHMWKLEEIPSCIGDISTLKTIELEGCNSDVIASAENIIKEQKTYANEDLHLQIVD